MPLCAILLAAALGPATQEMPPALPPPAQEEPPPQAAPAAPAPAGETTGVKSEDVSSGPSAEVQGHIDAGLAAFKKRRFAKAEIEFRQALDADPNSAAANFYLGYTYYKMGEPARRLNANKEKAKELFAKAFALDPQFKPVWHSPK